MKAFVGTLYSGENELEECITSIKMQTFSHYEQEIFRNLPNVFAHRTLFQTFLEQANDFDILIKVDADMVLCSNKLFSSIVDMMMQNPHIEVFAIAVKDFFSGTLINGLNTYRNTTSWDFSISTLFVDIPNTLPEHYYYDSLILAPAAIHCKNPSKFQSFHYGVHRGFKSIAKKHSTTHWALLEKTWHNFLRTRDVRIGLAVLGAELVYAGKFTKTDIDYTNPKVNQVLEDYRELDFQQLRNEVNRLRLVNWGFLPGNWRRAWLKRTQPKLSI